MIGHENKEYGYERLFEAVRYKPHSVPDLIREEPGLLNCKNYSGETVMHWFVVENNIEIVTLLFECGGTVSSYALTEACSLGLVDMVYLLLKMEVVPDLQSCRCQIKLGDVPKATTLKLKQAFHRFGYELYEA